MDNMEFKRNSEYFDYYLMNNLRDGGGKGADKTLQINQMKLDKIED